MSAAAVQVTVCDHSVERVCDHCPEHIKNIHRTFWQGFDK